MMSTTSTLLPYDAVGKNRGCFTGCYKRPKDTINANSSRHRCRMDTNPAKWARACGKSANRLEFSSQRRPPYQHFLAEADPSLVAEMRPSGCLPEVPELLAAASIVCGGAVDLVAVDMPLARSPIIGRRYSDNAVSKVYGARKCGTHSPSASRPGPMSDALNKGFARAGYPLQTDTITAPALIEVYPHPALVELTSARERLPYKASKTKTYWPSDPPSAEAHTSLSAMGRDYHFTRR